MRSGKHGGATVGKLFGFGRAMKGGIGSASLCADGLTVGALVAVNAIGDVFDAQGQVIAGARSEDGLGFAHGMRALAAGALPARVMPGTATTIGVVATDALLTKAQATQLASQAHHGLSRAVNPITVNDGDTFFALATGAAGRSGDLSTLGALAAEAVAFAIRNAARAAESLLDPALPAARDLAR
jgi:L-aminopeptidase/D-esterase-like protein